MGNFGKWIRRALYAIALVVVSVLFLEVGLRMAFQEKVRTLYPKIWDHSDAHVPKHSEGVHYYSDTGTEAGFDSSGFRKSHGSCRHDEARKVLIVGDSNIAALFLDDGDDLASQLARELNRRGCYHVKSFGVAGYGPDQSFFALQKIVSHERFDYVISHVFTDNDAGDLVRNSHDIEAVDSLSDSGYCYLEDHWLDEYLLPKVVRKVGLAITGNYVNWNRVRHSRGNDGLCVAVFHTPRESPLASLFARAAIDKQLLLEGKKQIYMADRYDVEFACRRDDELREYATSKLRVLANEVVSLATQHEFEPIFLLQPSEYDVTDNHPEISTAIRQQCRQYQPDNLINIYTAVFEPVASVINLYDEFRDCDECYFSKEELGNDNHWNSTGVAIAATAIAERIDP